MVIPIALSALRAFAMRRTRNATAKVRRIENTGIRVAGSEFDVRVPAERINKYTRKQLTSYLSRVDEFTSRSTKFVAGLRGTPLPYMEVGLAMQEQGLLNTMGDRLRRRNAGVMLPGQDLTVGDMIDRRPRSLINVPDNAILPQRELEPEGIPDASALRRRRRTMNRRMSPGYFRYRRDASITGLNKGLDEIGASDVRRAFEALTLEQKEYLVLDTDFLETVFAFYQDDDGVSESGRNILMRDYIAHAAASV